MEEGKEGTRHSERREEQLTVVSGQYVLVMCMISAVHTSPWHIYQIVLDLNIVVGKLSLLFSHSTSQFFSQITEIE